MNDFPERPPIHLVGLAESARLIRPGAPQELRHQIATRWAMVDDLDRRMPRSDALICPLCGHRASGGAGSFRPLMSYCIFGGGDLLRHVCPACDLVFGPQKVLALSEHALAEEYDWHYRVYTEGDSTDQEVRAFHALNPRRDGVYLNWGAGDWSRTLDVLRAEGWNVMGFEPHPSGATPRPGVITDWQKLGTMRFDGIFSNNVLEHLRYPVRELRAMAELLASGGRLSHATPCFAYRYEFTRFHIFFYPGRSRDLLARQAGLVPVSFTEDGDFMNMVLAQAAA